MTNPSIRESATPTASTGDSTNAVAAINVRQTVGALAERSQSRDEFLQLLGGEIGQWLSAALVAIDDAGWDQARMLVQDESIAAGINRDELRDRLASAGASVSSVKISVQTDAQLVMAGQPTESCVSLTAEICPAPHRCSVAVIQGERPDSVTMLPAMKLLNECVSAVRQTRFGSSATATATATAAGTQASSEIADTPRNRGVNQLDQLAAVRQSLRRFHQSLDPTATAYQIASELPRLLPCERAVVLIATTRGRRRRYKVRAISGSSVVDHRSPLVRTINRLADTVAVMNDAVILPPMNADSNDDRAGISGAVDGDYLPPQILEPLEEYLDESGVLSVAILPVYENSLNSTNSSHNASSASDNADGETTPRSISSKIDAMPLAIILLETFSGEPPTQITPAMREIGLEASVAMTNAMRYDDVFALPLRRPLAGLSRRAIRNWTVVLAFLSVGLAAASYFIRVDHHVVATGVARPTERRAVFASVDGIVQSIEVKDGDRISAGEPLIRLENAEIQRESQSLSGQLVTATAKLASLRSMQLAGGDDPREAAQNVIEQRTLESEIRMIGDRMKVNESMRSDLVIRAPIDGVIVGWRLNEKLQSRPIARGDRLLAVIAPDGDWELDLRLDETKAGEVMQRFHNGETLPVNFAIQTRPTETMAAAVQSMGGIARRGTDGINVVDVVAVIDPQSLAAFQIGDFRGDADVTAKIVCGQRRLIASWSEGLVAWFHRDILFRFQ
jgi:hypothetical protein